MKQLYKYTYVVILFFWFEGKLNAQSADQNSFYLQQLDNSSGLSNSAVNSVFQDNDNLLWVGTWDGLNMFDGTDFKVFNYTNSRSASGSIGNNVIQDITEGQNGNIWVNTIGGITRIDKKSGVLHQYFYNSRKRILEKEFDIVADSLGQVFCYSKTEGLTRYNSKINQFQKINYPSQGSKIIKMKIDDLGRLLLLQNNGEIIVSKTSSHDIKIIKVIKHREGIDNFFYLNGKLILVCKGSLLMGDAEFRFKKVKDKFFGARSISRFHSGYIVVSDSQELSIYNEHFQRSGYLREELKKLSGIRVTSAFSSKDGVLWLGTDGNGLIRIYPKKNYFGLIKSSDYNLNKPVRAFTEVNGHLWIGNKGKGILQLTNFWKNKMSPPEARYINTVNGLNDNSVFALKKGFFPYVYIGTDGAGITIYNSESNKIIKWANIKGTSGLPAIRSVYSIIQDRDSSLWMGTSGSGLIHLKLKTYPSGDIHVTYFKQYLSEQTPGLANDIIYSLANTDGRHLWIACRYGGLSVLDKKTGKFKTFKAFAYGTSLSNNDVLSLYSDNKKGLWIGTSFGLNYLKFSESLRDKPDFVKLTMDDGLPNNTIHGIEQANNGDIWLSTNKGLARLKPASRTITTYNENDGLQSNEFSDGAVWKSDSGHLFFGGIYGLNYFLPQNIRGNTIQPNLLISQLQIGGTNTNENRIQVLRSNPSETPKYVTERKMNFFRLMLKSISFTNPIKNEFTYKLEGYDKSWNYSGIKSNIIYNSIPPGDYTLLVRWTNEEGTWTKPVPIFKFSVKQYAWLTYWAFLLYAIIITVAGYAFHVYRKNKIQMKYKLEMEYHLRQKDESIHQQRLNFFTNIAHEIQTPLTLIMGSIEHYLISRRNELMKNKENSYFLSIVHQHSVRLTYLVQQLLEFRKAESGFLERNDDFIDISKMLNSLSSLFLTESEKNNKPYIIEVQDNIAGYIDKDKLEKILFNLLSNAFKHSGPQDTVMFKADFNEQNRLLCISVSNTGCTIREEDLKLLFNKFYTQEKTNAYKSSTGIGLAFAKELASLLQSHINVELKNGTIEFSLCVEINTSSESPRENEVATSAPSYLYESLLKNYEQPPILKTEDENKISLIDGLHQKSKYSILLVEDEKELRFLIHQVLKEKYLVFEAGNGVEALAFLKKNTPDLIISDLMMPEMDGLALCREVKNMPATAQIPFIMLSAKGSDDNKQEGYEMGADAYLPKPFNITYLLVRVRKILDYHIRMQNLVKDQNISNQFTNADIDNSDKKFLESILKVIEQNLDDPELNSSSIEKELFISKMQLYRKLKSLSGMTPAEFIKRIRLKYAADMLLSTQYTVSEIIYRTGFNSKSYFFREFKKIYHFAPNEYRARKYETSDQLS